MIFTRVSEVVEWKTCVESNSYFMCCRFELLSCPGSPAGRECRVSWVRIPPRAALLCLNKFKNLKTNLCVVVFFSFSLGLHNYNGILVRDLCM